MTARVCQRGHRIDPDVVHCRECARRRHRETKEVPGPHIPPPLGDVSWMDRAACRGHDPNLWFPEGEGWAALHLAREARAICFACPVQAECFDAAMTAGERYGIWGGFGAKFRHDLASRRANAGES